MFMVNRARFVPFLKSQFVQTTLSCFDFITNLPSASEVLSNYKVLRDVSLVSDVWSSYLLQFSKVVRVFLSSSLPAEQS